MPRRLPGVTLAVLLLLALIPALPTVSAPVTGVVVTTDRTDYVAGMNVTARASVSYTGPPGQVPDNALFEWFNSTWYRTTYRWAPIVRGASSPATATAFWTPPVLGVYTVNVTANSTKNPPHTPVPGAGTFRVWATSAYVVATGIVASTDRGAYDVGERVDATATLTWVGNQSLLERVRFDWYNPSGGLIRTYTDDTVTTGEATDSWVSTQVGTGYRVNVTYLGNDTASHGTLFDLRSVPNPVPSVGPGATVTLTASGGPWRGCGDVLVEATGTMVIEAGTTVSFCRDARLLVRGTLTAESTPAAPILLNSYDVPPSPGDWRGVRFEGGGGSRLTHVTIEDATDAVSVDAASPLLVGLAVRGGAGAALNATGFQGTVRDASAEGGSHGFWLRDSTAVLRNVTVTNATQDGIRVEGGSVQVRDAMLSGAGRSGVAVVAGGLSLENATFVGNVRHGLYAERSTGIAASALWISGGERGIRAVNDTGLAVDGANLTGALTRAIDLSGSSAIFSNATVSSAPTGRDFLLVESTAIVRNGSFADDAARRTLVGSSRLVVENFLSVRTRTGADGAIPGATVEVTVNGSPVPARTTDALGLASWITVEDRVYDLSGMTKNEVTVAVSAAGFEFNENPRAVDMATSHRQEFTGVRIDSGTDVDGGLGLGLLVVAVGLAVFGFGGVMYRRRRRRLPHEAEGTKPEDQAVEGEPGPSAVALEEAEGVPAEGPAAEPTPPRPVPEPEPAPAAPPATAAEPVPTVPTPPARATGPTPGTSYAVLGEKSDAAIRWFADATQRGGAPGICITRHHPGTARTRFRLEGIPIFWLSRTFGEETLNPTNLGAIVDLVGTRTKDRPGTYVLLDGLEYLFTQNDFPKIAKFVQALTDVVAQRRAILVLPLNPASFDPDQLAILSRDLTTWP